jgi:hypothetical protein
VVLSVPRSLDAFGSSNTVALNLDPFVSITFTGSFVVFFGKGFNFLSINFGGSSAPVFFLNILGFLLVNIAVLFSAGEDGNISPWRRMPVGIVIPFFSAFKTVSISIIILSGEDGGSSSFVEVSFLFSIRNPKTHVSFSGSASNVVISFFVLSVKVFIIFILFADGLLGVGNSISCGSVSNEGGGGGVGRTTHVLQDYVAIQSGSSTTVLVGPFDGQQRTFVKVHGGAKAITSFAIILGIEQAVSIISISVFFANSVIRTAKVVHVGIAEGAYDA